MRLGLLMIGIAVVLLPADAAALNAEDPPAPVAPEEIIDRFMEQAQQSDRFEATAKDFLTRKWRERRGQKDQDAFLLEALAVLYPRFKTGLDAFQAREFAYCAKVMGALSMSSDLYLGSYAALFQVKALIQEIELQYAEILLAHYRREDLSIERYNLALDEMTFLHGLLQYHTFDDENAKDTLNAFLQRYPDARPRWRAAAREMLLELQTPRRKDLDQVTHLMADAGLLLTEGEAGLDTQTRQKKAMLILEELVAQAEEQEQMQQQQQPQGQGSQAPGTAQQPTAPAQVSEAPQGESGVGDQHEAPRAKPGQMWGRMRPQQREKILQLLQENFPSRYRELVEQYYEELAKEE